MLIDAEAGIEQINREVTQHVNRVFVVVDTSRRSLDILQSIAGMVDPSQVTVVINRFRNGATGNCIGLFWEEPSPRMRPLGNTTAKEYRYGVFLKTILPYKQ